MRARDECVEQHGRSLADEVAAALTRAGFVALRSDAVPASTTVELRGAAHHVFYPDGFAITPEVSARLVLTTPSGLHAERRFYVRGETISSFSDESRIQQALDAARRRLAISMVAALAELLSFHPELGTPGARAPHTIHTSRER
jgi:hypothetical protein